MMTQDGGFFFLFFLNKERWKKKPTQAHKPQPRPLRAPLLHRRTFLGSFFALLSSATGWTVQGYSDPSGSSCLAHVRYPVAAK